MPRSDLAGILRRLSHDFVIVSRRAHGRAPDASQKAIRSADANAPDHRFMQVVDRLDECASPMMTFASSGMSTGTTSNVSVKPVIANGPSDAIARSA